MQRAKCPTPWALWMKSSQVRGQRTSRSSHQQFAIAKPKRKGASSVTTVRVHHSAGPFGGAGGGGGGQGG